MQAGVLAGKSAIVTGSSRGIGRAIAEAMAEAGARVALCSRNLKDSESVAEEIRAGGGDAIAFAADVTRPDDVRRLVEGTVETFGRLDILVNNAGITVTGPAEDLSPSDWDRVLATNLTGPFLCSQAAAKFMIPARAGRIINVASIFGLVGASGIAAYCASKGGVVQLTRALAVEWAGHGICVNAIAPGYVETELNREALQNERLHQRILQRTPMRRLGREEDLTDLCVLLASDASGFITGQIIGVDGGWTAW